MPRIQLFHSENWGYGGARYRGPKCSETPTARAGSAGSDAIQPNGQVPIIAQTVPKAADGIYTVSQAVADAAEAAGITVLD